MTNRLQQCLHVTAVWMPLMGFAPHYHSLPPPCFLLIFPSSSFTLIPPLPLSTLFSHLFPLCLSEDFIASEFHHEALLCSHCPCWLQTRTHMRIYTQTHAQDHNAEQPFTGRKKKKKKAHRNWNFIVCKDQRNRADGRNPGKSQLGSITQVRHI